MCISSSWKVWRIISLWPYAIACLSMSHWCINTYLFVISRQRQIKKWGLLSVNKWGTRWFTHTNDSLLWLYISLRGDNCILRLHLIFHIENLCLTYASKLRFVISLSFIQKSYLLYLTLVMRIIIMSWNQIWKRHMFWVFYQPICTTYIIAAFSNKHLIIWWIDSRCLTSILPDT